MSDINDALVLERLRSIRVPGTDQNIVELDMVKGLILKPVEGGHHVIFTIEVDPVKGPTLEPMRHEAERAVAQLAGVAAVSVVLTAHSKKASPPPQEGSVTEKLSIPGVKHVIAIASGKGGVGKSTTAVNLAVAMAMNGLKVGLMDADIYGPSIPRMLNLKGKPEARDDKKLIPMERYGLVAMSMGFLIAEDMPMIWRGPMVHSAIKQLFRDVVWGERDVIVADLPPGTGDAQLTMAQQVPLTGAIIVSTPQDIALTDARKGLNMFRRVNVPVLGIIENMSYFLCPHCGQRSDIFSHGGAHEEAKKLGVPFLGEVQLDMAIRQTSDDGEPIVIKEPTSDLAKNYRQMAERIWKELG